MIGADCGSLLRVTGGTRSSPEPWFACGPDAITGQAACRRMREVWPANQEADESVDPASVTAGLGWRQPRPKRANRWGERQGGPQTGRTWCCWASIAEVRAGRIMAAWSRPRTVASEASRPRGIGRLNDQESPGEAKAHLVFGGNDMWPSPGGGQVRGDGQPMAPLRR